MRGQWKYPELWDSSLQIALCPSQGCTWDRLRDYSGKQNHGTLTNMDPGTDWVPSQGQLALDLDGTNDYVDTADIEALDGAAAITVSAWINQTALTADKGIVAKWNYQTQGNFALQTQQSQPAGNIKVFLATTLTDAGNGYGEETTNAPHAANRWDHVAFTFRGGIGIEIHVNGFSCPLSRVGSPPATTVAGGTASLRVGMFQGLGREFNGMVDDIRAYSRGFSPQEIKLLATRRGIAYELAPRRRASAASGNRRRRLLIG